jgi:hypothetical protein
MSIKVNTYFGAHQRKSEFFKDAFSSLGRTHPSLTLGSWGPPTINASKLGMVEINLPVVSGDGAEVFRARQKARRDAAVAFNKNLFSD